VVGKGGDHWKDLNIDGDNIKMNFMEIGLDGVN
jgi:hypothetical protein